MFCLLCSFNRLAVDSVDESSFAHLSNLQVLDISSGNNDVPFRKEEPEEPDTWGSAIRGTVWIGNLRRRGGRGLQGGGTWDNRGRSLGEGEGGAGVWCRMPELWLVSALWFISHMLVSCCWKVTLLSFFFCFPSRKSCEYFCAMKLISAERQRLMLIMLSVCLWGIWLNCKDMNLWPPTTAMAICALRPRKQKPQSYGMFSPAGREKTQNQYVSIIVQHKSSEMNRCRQQ